MEDKNKEIILKETINIVIIELIDILKDLKVENNKLILNKKQNRLYNKISEYIKEEVIRYSRKENENGKNNVD